MNIPQQKRLAVAPMMEWTDRHCRSFHRALTKEAVLYTEMVTTGALMHGDVPRHLDYSSDQHPRSDQMPWLTWKESAQSVLKTLLN